MNSSTACDFCDNEVIEKQSIFEGKLVRVLYPQHPIVWGHVLVMPKRHIQFFFDLTDEELVEMKNILKEFYLRVELDKELIGINLLNNNGSPQAGQHIPHTHVHAFLRLKDEKTSPFKAMSNPELKETLTDDEWKDRKVYFTKFFSK